MLLYSAFQLQKHWARWREERYATRAAPRERAWLSDSVGSTMSVPDTGQDMVGAWKP